MWDKIVFEIKDNLCEFSSPNSQNCSTHLLLGRWTWKSSHWKIPPTNNKNRLQVGREMPSGGLRPTFQPFRKNWRARSNRRGRRIHVRPAKISPRTPRWRPLGLWWYWSQHWKKFFYSSGRPERVDLDSDCKRLDGWAGYQFLQAEGYTHEVVNHSVASKTLRLVPTQLHLSPPGGT